MTYTLERNADGSYNVLLRYEQNDTEFSMDFFSNEALSRYAEEIGAFLERQGKNLRLHAVTILISGVIIASIPAVALIQAQAAQPEEGRYSMAYLYTGSDQQQIQYVKNADISLHVVAPSWFDIRSDGSLLTHYLNPTLIGAMHAEGIRVVPFLSNHWDRAGGIAFLQNIDANSTALANAVLQNNLDGVNVDIENVTHNERAQYAEFVRQLRQKLPPDKEVSVAVAANPNGWTSGWHGSYDYAKLGQYADHLFLMTYDESWQGGPAGPVASIGFVERSVQYALRYVPSEKIVLGLPLFGRLWSDSGFNGNGVYLSYAATLLNSYNAVVSFDEQSLSPKASFTVREGDPAYSVNGKKLLPGNYTLWFENKVSIEKKLGLVTKYNLKGAGSWALGQETQDIWEDYTAVLNNRSSTTANTGTGGADTSSDASTPDTTKGDESPAAPEPTTATPTAPAKTAAGNSKNTKKDSSSGSTKTEGGKSSPGKPKTEKATTVTTTASPLQNQRASGVGASQQGSVSATPQTALPEVLTKNSLLTPVAVNTQDDSLISRLKAALRGEAKGGAQNSFAESAQAVAAAPESVMGSILAQFSQSAQVNASEEKTQPLINETALTPRNLVESAHIGIEDAIVYDAPHGSVIGRVAAGSALFLFGISAAGYYVIRWKQGQAFIRQEAVVPK